MSAHAHAYPDDDLATALREAREFRGDVEALSRAIYGDQKRDPGDHGLVGDVRAMRADMRRLYLAALASIPATLSVAVAIVAVHLH